MVEAISEHVANFVASTHVGQVPPTALGAAKRVLLDATGVMIGASGVAKEAEPFVALARLSGTGRSSILGTHYEVPAPAAALANGAFAHALDFEDAFELSPGHPNASLVPALLALAQDEGQIDGNRFLTALAVGCDVACRMALALRQPMEANGWYPPPILAGFGAVAGAANLLRLDAVQVRSAISLMLCQTTMPGEIKYSSGTQIRAVREAFPAQAAVNSVLLSRSGLRGFERPLEGRAGFYELYAGGHFDADALVDRLGDYFWIEQLTFKPWPSCRGTHAFIEMALELRQQHGIGAGDVAEVIAGIDDVHVMLFEPNEARRKPASAIEAKFSIPFTLALALIRGRVGLDDFGDGDLQDPSILALAARVSSDLTGNAPWRAGTGGALTVVLNSGERLQAQVENALGCPSNPLSDASLIDKFILCVGKGYNPVSSEDALRLAEMILAVEECNDVGALFKHRPSS
jgi:2-methylcitrate dehydratase PrpD